MQKIRKELFPDIRYGKNNMYKRRALSACTGAVKRTCEWKTVVFIISIVKQRGYV